MSLRFEKRRNSALASLSDNFKRDEVSRCDSDQYVLLNQKFSLNLIEFVVIVNNLLRSATLWPFDMRVHGDSRV